MLLCAAPPPLIRSYGPDVEHRPRQLAITTEITMGRPEQECKPRVRKGGILCEY